MLIHQKSASHLFQIHCLLRKAVKETTGRAKRREVCGLRDVLVG